MTKAAFKATAVFKKMLNEGGWIFLSAILISLVWHLFWISAVRIVYKADDTDRVKFSKVSFLGPIFEGRVANISAQPKERSFLEKRYLENLGSIKSGGNALPRPVYDAGIVIYNGQNTGLKPLIEKALESSKAQPPGVTQDEILT